MPDTSFDVWLKTHFDGDALRAARQSFDQTKQSAKGAAEGTDAFSSATKALKAELAGLLAVSEIWGQFKEGFEQVAALEQSMNQLDRAAARFGHNAVTVREQIVGMADALKKAAGVDDDAAIRAMTDLYSATGDVANAMALAALAADVAVGANKPFEESLQLVTSAAQGKTRALVALKLAQEDDTEATLTAQKALDRIRVAYGGAAKEATGLQVEVNRLSEAWEDLRNGAVERLSPALYVVLKVISSLMAYWTALGDSITSTAPRLLDSISSMSRGMWESIKGNFGSAQAEFAHAKALATTNAAEIAAIGERLKAKLDDIWNGKGAKSTLAADAPKSIGGGLSDQHKDQKERDLTYDEWYQMEVSRIQQEMYDEARKAAEKLAAYEKKLRSDGLKDSRKTYEQSVKDAEDAAFARARLQAAEITKELKLKQDAAKAERAMAEETLSIVAGSLSTLFGESKAIAIAEAIINTYLGASKAIAQGGIWGAVQAAVVIAAGLAQVAKIQSTNPDRTQGQGFDDTGNDAAARLGGRRWALDMIGEWQKGVSAGWAAGMGGGSTTYDNRQTYNVTVPGLLDPSNMTMLVQLHRNLQVVGKQIEGQRSTVRR